MTDIAEQRSRRRSRRAAGAAQPAAAAPAEPAISPQDFYREMVEREDVQRILTRLAQIKDGTI